MHDRQSSSAGSAGTSKEPSRNPPGDAAHRADEQRLSATYDLAPIGIAETDRGGGFLRVNHALCALTGYTREELLVRRFADITDPGDIERDLELYRRQWSGEIDSYTFEKRCQLEDGGSLWVSVSSSVVRDAAGQPLYAIRVTQNIGDRKRAEESLAEETRSLETLNRVGALLAAELDLDRLVQAVTEAATELTGAQFGAFFYNTVDEHGHSYRLYTLSGIPRAAFEGLGMPRMTAVFDPTFRGEGVVRSDDITLDPRYGKTSPHRGMPKGHPPVRSYLAVPVIARSGEVLGGLFFGHEKVGVFTARGACCLRDRGASRRGDRQRPAVSEIAGGNRRARPRGKLAPRAERDPGAACQDSDRRIGGGQPQLGARGRGATPNRSRSASGAEAGSHRPADRRDRA